MLHVYNSDANVLIMMETCDDNDDAGEQARGAGV